MDTPSSGRWKTAGRIGSSDATPGPGDAGAGEGPLPCASSKSRHGSGRILPGSRRRDWGACSCRCDLIFMQLVYMADLFISREWPDSIIPSMDLYIEFEVLKAIEPVLSNCRRQRPAKKRGLGPIRCLHFSSLFLHLRCTLKKRQWRRGVEGY